jgi:hypothetical protein
MYKLWTPLIWGKPTMIGATWKQSDINVINACVTLAGWVVATDTEVSLSDLCCFSTAFHSFSGEFAGRPFGDKYVLTGCLVSWQELSFDGTAAAGVVQSRLTLSTRVNAYPPNIKFWSTNVKGRDLLEDLAEMHLVCEWVTFKWKKIAAN